MNKKKCITILIDMCIECPFAKQNTRDNYLCSDDGLYICSLKNESIYNYNTIPEWCPLSDYNLETKEKIIINSLQANEIVEKELKINKNQKDDNYSIEKYLINISKIFSFKSFKALCYHCKSEFELSLSNKELLKYLHEVGFKFNLSNEKQTYKGIIEFKCPKCKNLVTIYITKLTI